MQAITTEGLTKYYGTARGIKDINLSVEEGDFFGFIGPNGAGKSTTIRSLLGMIRPTGGSARIFDRDIRQDNTNILADIGYLPSETMFYGGMRVRDVLKLSAQLRKMDCAEEAAYLCDRLSLDTTRKINELSLGNRKKVGIVCTMQHKPKLYVMDEPTSGLDPLMQREFYALLSERNQKGATVFLSSHILSEVQRYCKHAAIIREGELIVADSVENLGHTNAKRIILSGVTTLPSMENIRDLKAGEDSVSFLYSGGIKELLQMLAALPVTDLTIAEPDLEEIFMHYYAEHGQGGKKTKEAR